MNMLIKTFLLLLLPIFATGQYFKINVDSIKQALKTAPNDSVAFNLNSKLAAFDRERNRDTSLYYLEKKMFIAQKNNKKLDEVWDLSSKGYLLNRLGKLSESYQCLTLAFKIAENPQNEGKTFGFYSEFGYNPNWTLHQKRLFFLCDLHMVYGFLMGSMRKTDQQIFHFNEAMKISEAIGDSTYLGLANMHLGYLYMPLGKLDSALVMEQNAERLISSGKDKKYLGEVYKNMGQIFWEKQKTALAVYFFHKGVETSKEQNYEVGLSLNYSLLTKYYLNTEKNRDSCLYYALKNLEVLKSMGSKDLAEAYTNLSDSYTLNNKTDSAFKYKNLAYNSLDSASNSKIESLTKAQSLAFDDQLKLKVLEKEKADEKNKLRTIMLLAGLGVMFLVGFLLYRNNRQKQKANGKLQTTLQELQTAQSELENKNRESQIEVALEKVRGKAMSMHNSSDISVTASMVFTELRKLGINPIRCGIGLLNKESRKGQLYSAISSAQGDSLALVGWAELSGHPELENIYSAWLNNADYFPELSGEQLQSYYQLVLKGLSVNVPESNQKQYGTFLSFSVGSLYTWSESPYTETEIKTLRRFANIFDLTFRRYIELQQSETNAKEAVKRAALDRIRADIASMRTISDLERIIPLIWNELTTLGVSFIRCGVFIIDEAQEQIHIMLSTPTGKSIAAFYLPINTAQGSFTEIVAHWRKHTLYKDHWDQAAFVDFTANLLKQGTIASSEQYATDHPPMQLDLQFLPFAQGMLYVGSETPLNTDELETVQSLADAFSSAYSRYEDFNKLDLAKQEVDKTLIELKQTQAQLVQKEKLASLGELTAGIAHEIQNPLNFVNNFSELSIDLTKDLNAEIIKRPMDEDYVKELMHDLSSNQEKINLHGKRASSIVKGMLEHSRMNTGVKELTDINKLCDEYFKLSYHGLRAKDKNFNCDMITNFDASIPEIEIVPQDIGRVVLNLINNAFYAVNERANQKRSGNFENSLNVETWKPTVTVEIRHALSLLEICIKDNGIGMSEAVKQKVFQPFFTTKPTGSGTGLGLSLAYDIVTKGHGGTLKVESVEGEGSEFTLQLPVMVNS